jgi:regulator of protease activity HflC (stomatin/prohibitin superfamily)
MDWFQTLFPFIMGFMWLIIIGVQVRRSRFTILENERLLIFRLGKPVGIHGPGSVMIVPFFETGVKYDVSDHFDAKLIDSYLAQGVKLRQG